MTLYIIISYRTCFSVGLLLLLPLLEPLDEGVDEVDAGKLHEGSKHRRQAEDDVHVHRSGVANLAQCNEKSK